MKALCYVVVATTRPCRAAVISFTRRTSSPHRIRKRNKSSQIVLPALHMLVLFKHAVLYIILCELNRVSSAFITRHSHFAPHLIFPQFPLSINRCPQQAWLGYAIQQLLSLSPYANASKIDRRRYIVAQENGRSRAAEFCISGRWSD